MSALRTEGEVVGALAFFVVRAGARDGMAWWDDEALTEAGTYALAKIFPRNPARVAVRLAFRAARERHAGVLSAASVTHRTTLLDLAEREPHFLDGARALAAAPIISPEHLRARLAEVAPEITSIPLPVPCPEGLLDMTELARGTPARQATVLAAGYLVAVKGRPVFPFLRPETDRRP